jgi:Spy/CpxP family protein refolding chaperone
MRPNALDWVPAVLLLAALAAPAAAQQRTGFPWWTDPKVVKELGLTPDQSARIDKVFRANFPQLRQSREELEREEEELSRLIATNADDGTVVRQIDKVEAVRASLNKTRTLMLLHMVRKLSAEQRVKFNPVYEQWRRDNPPPPRPSDTSSGSQPR